MKSLVTLARTLHEVQAIRFLVAGGLNTLFGYAVYLGGLGLKLTPTLALAIATLVGAIFNYFTTARYVFAHRTVSRLPIFVAAYALIYLVNAGAIRVLLNSGTSPAPAQAILVPFMAVLSFVIFRNFVFRRD